MLYVVECIRGSPLHGGVRGRVCLCPHGLPVVTGDDGWVFMLKRSWLLPWYGGEYAHVCIRARHHP